MFVEWKKLKQKEKFKLKINFIKITFSIIIKILQMINNLKLKLSDKRIKIKQTGKIIIQVVCQ